MKIYKILIIAPNWIGDAVMSHTLILALHAKHKVKVEIDVITSALIAPVYQRMLEVKNVISCDFKHGKLNLLDRIKLGMSLKQNHYNQAFILPNSWKSALVPFFARIKKRTGFVGEMRYGLLNDPRRKSKNLLRLIDQYCALGNNALDAAIVSNKIQHIPKLLIDKDNQDILMEKFRIDKNSNIIAFCPGAEYGKAKRWPVESFAKLADTLIAQYKCKILILGGPKELKISQVILKLSNHKMSIINLCGKTSIKDAIDLLGLSSYVITNDSGLMHVACAVNRPQVLAVYGSSSPSFTPPLSHSAHIIYHKIECSPCFERTCRFGHYKCLTSIGVDNILSCIKSDTMVPKGW